jgi:hypothetical protein
LPLPFVLRATTTIMTRENNRDVEGVEAESIGWPLPKGRQTPRHRGTGTLPQ